MAKVYTFPTQYTKAGTLAFEVTASSGSGTEAISDKYFSSELSVRNQTEFEGGDIQSSVVQFTIDDDKDALFAETIFASLNDGYVLVKVSLDGDTLFHGSVSKQSITQEYYYATNDSFDNKKSSISFQCFWVLDLLKNIGGSDLFQHILTNILQYDTNGSPYNDGSGGNELTLIRFRYIIKALFDKLSADYGFTNTVIFDNGQNTFYPTMSGVPLDFSAWWYPSPPTDSAYRGVITADALDLGIILTNSAGDATGFWDVNDEKYIKTAYDYLVGFLKSFGYYCIFEYDEVNDFNIRITTRVSGSDKTNSFRDVLSFNRVLFSTLARNGIDITSLTNGNAYEKAKFEDTTLSASKYTEELLFDFHNNNDFPGRDFDSANGILSEYSTMVYNGIYQRFQLVREAGVGENIIKNQSFEDGFANWDEDTGVWEYASVDSSGAIGSYAKTTIAVSGSSQISQTLDEPFPDYAILGCVVSHSANRSLNVELFITDSLDNVVDSSTLVFAAVPSTDQYLAYYVYRLDKRSRGVINKISIKVINNDVFSDTVYISKPFLKRNRRGTPELVGTMIEDYFSSDTERHSYELNGILKDIEVGDFITRNDVKFYVNKIEFKLDKNETEIEAINYPY